MSLIDRMTALNARLVGIPIRLGVPQYRNLLVRHVFLDDDLLETSHEDTLFQPRPTIDSVPMRLVGLDLGRGITVEQSDFQIAGIPRSYSLDFLQANVGFYVVDPAQSVSGAIAYDSRGNPQGTMCKLLHVDDQDLLTWTLLLRNFRDTYDTSQTTVNY